jgi:hypothetical protein
MWLISDYRKLYYYRNYTTIEQKVISCLLVKLLKYSFYINYFLVIYNKNILLLLRLQILPPILVILYKN